jgi:dephospho-CoA kinase
MFATGSDGVPGDARPLVVGVVGESGSGKTVVLSMLGDLGAATIEADAIAREVVAPGSDVLRGIADSFGSRFLLPDGSLDRKSLGRLVFADEAARRRLNALVHPAMLSRIETQVQDAMQREVPPRVIALEAAVLEEMGALELVDVLVMVRAPRDVRLDRICRRDNLSGEDADARLAAQEQAGLGELETALVVDNGGDVARTREAVRVVWQQILETGKCKKRSQR